MFITLTEINGGKVAIRADTIISVAEFKGKSQVTYRLTYTKEAWANVEEGVITIVSLIEESLSTYE